MGYRALSQWGYARSPMPTKDIQVIRHANLLLLLTECGRKRGAQAKLSRLTGVSAPYISQHVNFARHSRGAKRTMGDVAARMFERGMGKEEGWMDHDHSSGARTELESHFLAVFRSLSPEQQDQIHALAAMFAKGNKPPPDDETPGDEPTVRH